MSYIPLILELDEELKEGEEFVKIKCILVEHKGGYSKIGYVAVIRFYVGGERSFRYGNLKATQYTKKEFQTVL